MFERVLLPLDGSALAERMIPYVSTLVGRLQGKLVLLSVIVPSGVSQTAAFARKRYLEEVEGRLSEDGIDVESMIASGYPAQQILRVAELEECGLIAIASHGRNALGRAVFGSVADSVIRRSVVPVLALGPHGVRTSGKEVDTISTIIVPLDGSAFAETALPIAEELTGRLSVELVLARVINTGGPYSGLLDDSANVEVDPEIKSAAFAYLNKLRWKLAERGMRARTVLLEDTPGKRIADLASATMGSVVVMATHGRSGLARLADGSVTQSVIRSSEHPVLVVPPPAAA